MKTIILLLTAITLSPGYSMAQDDPPVDRTPVTIDSTRDVEIPPEDKTDVKTTAREMLRVADMTFCEKVENREPMQRSSEFAVDIGRLYFWSNITNSGDSTHISHVWYHAGKQLANIQLPVTNIRNRVWSSKEISIADTGIWKVEIVKADSTVLAADSCRVKAQ